MKRKGGYIGEAGKKISSKQLKLKPLGNIFGGIFLELQKMFFFLSGQALSGQ